MILVVDLVWDVLEDQSGTFSKVFKQIFRFSKILSGLLNSPKKERFFGGIQHLKRRAPVLGGSFYKTIF